ncbi:MAG: hypothetical protein V1729_05170 [Candidatus Woesearchaeota archaeon]
MELTRISKNVNHLSFLIILINVLLISGCVPDAGDNVIAPDVNQSVLEAAQEVQIETDVQSQGLQIVLKDPGMPEVKYLQPTVIEVQLQNIEDQWITIWSNPEGKVLKLTSDGAEMLLDTVIVPAGHYVGTRLKVSTIDVEVDVNRDGDTLDKNVQLTLTLEEFNKLPEKDKPQPPAKPSPPSPPDRPSPPDKPSKPQPPTGSATDDLQTSDKPAKPEKPSEPEAPSRPPEPQGPGGASPQGGQEPPYRIEGNLVYMPKYLDEKHTVTLNDYIFPRGEEMWKTDFVYSGSGGRLICDFTLRPLNIKGEQITLEVYIEDTSIPPSVITVSALTLSRPSVIYGASSIGTVTLSDPAPTGDQVIQLSTTPDAPMTLPTSMIIKAGEMSGKFNIKTNPVTSSVNATITATLSDSQKTAILTVTLPTCSETDNGKDYEIKGSITEKAGFGGLSGNDHCQNDIELNEYYCLDTPKSTGGMADSIRYKCPNGCKDGACLPATLKSCNDSDGGKNYDVKGSVETSDFSGNDGCQDDTKLIEYYCLTTPSSTGDMFGIEEHVCPNGCSDGTCLPAPPKSCIDSDGGKNYEVKGSVETSDFSGNDGCQDDTKLIEYYCLTAPSPTGDMFGVEEYSCPNGCSDGTCLPAHPILLSLTVSLNSVIGGDPSVGTVTLSNPAPAGGQVVQLSTNPSTSLTLPASMTVAASETSGTFNIPTNMVGSPVDVTITATSYDSQKTAQLRINQMPAYCPYTCRTPKKVSGGWSGPTWVTECESNEIPIQSSCPSVTQQYSCGVFGWSTCYYTGNSICCKSK